MASLGLVASACGSDGGGSGPDSSEPVTVAGCQPQNPLVPGDTGESCGHDIVELFTSTLFRYDPETSEPVPDLAESVTTEDNQNFTVNIKEGATFHDGSPVTAQSFVDAWNYTAYAPNGQYLSYFFAPIEGFEDVQCQEENDEGECTQDPTAETMSGLEVVDENTFTITTSQKVSNLPMRLGYTAFAPLPEAFFEDPEAFEKNPIGAGPYRVEEWSPNQRAVLTKYDDYGGDAAAGNVENITFRVYDDDEASYNDLLAGNVDIHNQLPTSALADDKFKSDLGDRWAQESYPAIQTITFPPDGVNPAYADPKLRKAVSMAIDREKVIQDQFFGAREPATSWGAPGIEGFNEDTCGDLCTYDPQRAKQLFQEAGGFDGKMAISYNADSDHKPWVTSTCNSIRETLGVDCVASPVPDFATFRDQIGNGQMESMFRSGWIADYPHIENFLTPLYGSGGSSNDNKYNNPAFDQKLKQAAQTEGEESLQLYKEAEEMLAQDMPAIPLWYYSGTIGWSEDVEDVRLSKASGRADLLGLSKSE